VFGLHDYIRDICRRLAKAGYCAIAPDFFARKGNAATAATFDEVKVLVEAASYPQVTDDIKAMIAWLKSKPDLGQPKKKAFADTRRIGTTGFCWGGAVVWMAAETLPEIKAGVAWYGRLETPAPDQFMGAEKRPWPIDGAKALNKPVLGLYGALDQGIPLDSVERMRAELAKGHSKSEIVVYPKSGHAFHADYRKSYNEADAKDGWARLLGWFDAHL
jgi:carboxymethylenebutenolidase